MAKVTANAQLLLGYLAALLKEEEHDGGAIHYSIEEVHAADAAVVIRSHSGNTFRLSIVQIGGVE